MTCSLRNSPQPLSFVSRLYCRCLPDQSVDKTGNAPGAWSRVVKAQIRSLAASAQTPADLRRETSHDGSTARPLSLFASIVAFPLTIRSVAALLPGHVSAANSAGTRRSFAAARRSANAYLRERLEIALASPALELEGDARRPTPHESAQRNVVLTEKFDAARGQGRVGRVSVSKKRPVLVRQRRRPRDVGRVLIGGRRGAVALRVVAQVQRRRDAPA